MKFMKIWAVIAILALLLCGCQVADPAGTTTPTNESTNTPSISIPTKPSTKPTDGGKETYTIIVLDQNGDPVENVIIQFCDDENCKLPVATDANGTVSASYAKSEYHVTVTELPSGYTIEETVFYFEGSNELTITVTAES